MSPVEAFLAGIAPQHALALAAGILAALCLGTAARRRRPWVPVADRWAGVLLGVSAAVHLALPLNPHHGGPVNAAFLASGAAYAVLARRALLGRRWRLASALLVPATLVAYLAAVVGGEEADQVGIATALVELTILGLALVPGAPAAMPGGPAAVSGAPTAAPGAGWRPGRRRLARFAAGATTMTATFLVGAVVWVASFVAHERAATALATNTTNTTDATEVAATDEHSHGHGHAGRAQAGVIMRPAGADHHPSDAQRRAAAELAAATAQATAEYASLDAAMLAGYRPGLGMQGPDVHLENKAYTSDGRTLDPQRPEMLVYAVDGDRATLLGVVYVMEVAGRPGPAPGGAITQWHAHNLCISAAPPGLGIVSPFGGCPAMSVSVTSPEMMHVWVVDNPAGPFADRLDKSWVWAYHHQHSRPFHRWTR